ATRTIDRYKPIGLRCALSAGRSDEGAKSRDRLADDQGVHLRRAFIGIDGLRVGDETPNVVFEQNAIAAKKLACVAYGLAAFDGGESLRKRSMLVLHQPLVL